MFECVWQGERYEIRERGDALGYFRARLFFETYE